MKRIIILCILGILNSHFCFSQNDRFKYLGQTEPTDVPRIFYLPIVEGVIAERIAIAANYREIFFTEIHPELNTEHIIKYYQFKNGNWYGPYIFNQKNNEYGPLFSPDNNTLFINGDYCNRTDTGWTAPSRFMNNRVIHYLQATNQGHYYFLSHVNDSITDVFKATITDRDTLLLPLKLNMKSNVTNDYYIDPDEDFILISLNKTEIDCYGGKDIFIRYKTKNGWTNPINLGKHINTENAKTRFGMCLSPDKKFMFYTQIDASGVHIFWVKIDELFKQLKEDYLEKE